MQLFIPFANLTKIFQCLDWKRLGKQRVEAKQILNILLDRTTLSAWRSLPLTKMWTPYPEFLKLYFNLCVKEWVKRGYKNNMELEKCVVETEEEFMSQYKHLVPPWWGDEELHGIHRANLLRKESSYYDKFEWKEKPRNGYLYIIDTTRRYTDNVVLTHKTKAERAATAAKKAAKAKTQGKKKTTTTPKKTAKTTAAKKETATTGKTKKNTKTTTETETEIKPKAKNAKKATSDSDSENVATVTTKTPKSPKATKRQKVAKEQTATTTPTLPSPPTKRAKRTKATTTEESVTTTVTATTKTRKTLTTAVTSAINTITKTSATTAAATATATTTTATTSTTAAFVGVRVRGAKATIAEQLSAVSRVAKTAVSRKRKQDV